MPPLHRSWRFQSTVAAPNPHSFHASTTTPVPVVHSSSPQSHRALSGLLVAPYTSTRHTRKSLRLFFAQSPPRLYFSRGLEILESLWNLERNETPEMRRQDPGCVLG